MMPRGKPRAFAATAAGRRLWRLGLGSARAYGSESLRIGERADPTFRVVGRDLWSGPDRI
jgi:hypothetical protein